MIWRRWRPESWGGFVCVSEGSDKTRCKPSPYWWETFGENARGQEMLGCLMDDGERGRQISIEPACKATQTEWHMSKTVQAETDKRGQSKQVVGGSITNTVRYNRGWWTDEGGCTAFSVIPLSSAINQGSVLHYPLLHSTRHHAGKRVSARMPRFA